jgi:hypothetical protein
MVEGLKGAAANCIGQIQLGNTCIVMDPLVGIRGLSLTSRRVPFTANTIILFTHGS